MRTIAVLILLSIQGCLSGCFMNPTDAGKLLGFDKAEKIPVLIEVDVKEPKAIGNPSPYKWRTKIPVDFVGRADVKTNPATGALEMTIVADVKTSEVIKAEGERLTDNAVAMVKVAEETKAAMTKMAIDAFSAGLAQGFAFAAPLLAPKPPKPEPTVPPIPFPLPGPLEPVP